MMLLNFSLKIGYWFGKETVALRQKSVSLKTMCGILVFFLHLPTCSVSYAAVILVCQVCQQLFFWRYLVVCNALALGTEFGQQQNVGKLYRCQLGAPEVQRRFSGSHPAVRFRDQSAHNATRTHKSQVCLCTACKMHELHQQQTITLD